VTLSEVSKLAKTFWKSSFSCRASDEWEGPYVRFLSLQSATPSAHQ
jgi:hypothetical protein